MLYAIISDIHANAAALRATLADAHRRGVKRVVCLGDVVGYGPAPKEALALVRRTAAACIAGNHDSAVSGARDINDFNDFAADAVSRHQVMLGKTEKEWLRRLPHVWTSPPFKLPQSGESVRFACAHGSFDDPQAFNYIFEADDAAASWNARSEPLLFVGHTHVPALFVLGASGTPHKLEPTSFVMEPGKRYIVNPGSVGFPRSGTGACFSSYCIFNDSTAAVEFVTVPFDLRSVMPAGGAEHVRKGRKTAIAISSAAVAAALAGAAAYWLAPRERTVTRVETKIERRVETRTVVQTVQATNAIPPEATAATAADALFETVRSETMLISPDVRKLYLAMALTPDSPKVHVRMRFWNGFGSLIGEETIQVSQRCGGKGGRVIKVPETAVRMVADVRKARGAGACGIARWWCSPNPANGRKRQ